MRVGLLIAVAGTLFALLAVQELSNDTFTEFEEWKRSHKAEFETDAEEFYRRKIFYRNLAIIEQHNGKEAESYKMGINQFTAYTQEQFTHRLLGLGQVAAVRTIQKSEEKVEAVIVDWVERGAVGPVKNQGLCGGAALYSTLGGVEALNQILSGRLETFSEQQLIDCAFGCSGAQPTQGYNYYKNYSICTAKEYPSTGRAGSCQAKNCSFKISEYNVTNTCSDLANAVTQQPISVTVDASRWSTYSSGIFNNCATTINHMVLLVGLADEYWRCKNSWGRTWGEQGYIRLKRGNTCAICDYAVFPLK